MDRSRSSKRYYYDHQDYDSEVMPRTKPRYNNGPPYHHNNNNHRLPPRSIAGNVGGGRKLIDPSLSVTTSYKILCHDSKAGGVIGKSGSIIKAIRQHTGAWINVHEMIPGDEERVIEISDTRRRDPDGRMPEFSPAQEALFLIHERILENDVGPGSGGVEEGYGYGNGRGGGEKQLITRLVVSRLHVGSLMGRGGKIIEQMRMETKTHIRILPRDPTIPRCVAMSEEIVQVVGGVDAIKNAIAVISSRLRECQHRDRDRTPPFQGRMHSPDRFLPPDDGFIPHMDNGIHRSPVDGPDFGSRFPNGRGGNNYSARHYDYALDSEASLNTDSAQFYYEDLVFRILCPTERVDSVVGVQNGIIDMLNNVVGVDVRVLDPIAGAKEQIIVVTSDEGPDHDLFPAQEALLHIQTRIVDLEPEKETFVTTRLVLHSDEISCFGGKRGSTFSAIKEIADVEVEILPREELPVYLSDTDEILQIVGEIRAARIALLEVTEKLRSYIFRGSFPHKDNNTHGSFVSISSSPMKNNNNHSEIASDRKMLPLQDDLGSELSSMSTRQNVVNTGPAQLQTNMVTAKSANDSVTTAAGSAVKQIDSERPQEVPNVLNRISMPVVTRSTLEVVIPSHVASKLVTKSRNKLAQISELSGANVQLTEDNKADAKEKVIRIAGTPEQAERAQSLLQGFILSIEEDEP